MVSNLGKEFKTKKVLEKLSIYKNYLILEGKLNIIEYLNAKEHPIKLDFLEVGDAGSLHYKYRTEISLFNKLEKLYMNYKEVRNFSEKKPPLIVANNKEISKEIYKEFLLELQNRKITELNRNFITEEDSKQIANFFSIELGKNINVRFDYYQSHKENSEFEPFEDIVQSLKNLLFSNFP